MTHTPWDTRYRMWTLSEALIKCEHHFQGKHHELVRRLPTTGDGVLSTGAGWGAQNRRELVTYSVKGAGGEEVTRRSKTRFVCTRVDGSEQGFAVQSGENAFVTRLVSVIHFRINANPIPGPFWRRPRRGDWVLPYCMYEVRASASGT